jgi:RNA polymerase sigma-70 factor (ECF subfamily)
VRSVVYLVFNEGYSSVRVDLCDEAVWLGRLLHRLLPNDSETTGLLALMLLHHARTPARRDADGRPVPLAEQDRTRWRTDLIAEGTALLDAALTRRAPGPYQLQAAIAALHAQAAGVEDTDWPQISVLYAELARRTGSPVVEVNRAVAVGMADGPHAGLAVLGPVLESGALDGYAPLHAAYADLLDRAGDPRAGAAWVRAIEATRDDALRAELRRRRAPNRSGSSASPRETGPAVDSGESGP